MSEMDLSTFLKELDFERYADSFHEILNGENLTTLSYSQVKQILPFDDVEKFWRALQNYCKKVDSASTIENNPHSSRPPLEEVTNNADIRTNNPRQRVNTIFVTENINIRNILSSTFDGQNILDAYTSKRRLDRAKRTIIVHLVMIVVLQKCKRLLDEPDFCILSRKITEVFPTELACIYYTPAVPKNKCPNGTGQRAAGKLLNKYNNLKRLPVGVFKPVQEETTLDDSEIDLSEEEKKSVEWLRTQEEPWDIAKQHWKDTYNYRHNSDDKQKLVSITLDVWSILKSSKGHELIAIDFDLSNICKVKDAIDNFNTFYLKVTETRSAPNEELCNALKDYLEKEELNEDSKVYVELLLLSFMLPSYIRVPQGNKKFWRPTCMESFEGIITHAKIYGDIQKTKEDRRVFARSKNITLQPYILVVGEDDFTVDSIYLIIDDIEYEIPSLKEALDYCFKSFHVFCAKYPPQSEHIWLLLQLGIYQFRTRWDPLTLSVDELLNDIQIVVPPLI